MERFMKISLIALVFYIFSIPSLLFADDPSKDPFYTAGHSISAQAEGLSSEYVDPYSGYLTINNTDIFLPGNGGLDLKIMRTYSSCIWGRRDVGSPGLIARNENSPLGIGWSMHMGIVRNPYSSGIINRFLPDHPVVEMPDGSQHVFYKDKNDTTRFISKDFWIYKSIASGIWELTLTDGTIYTFKYNNTNAGYATFDGVLVAQATKIENAAGTSSITIDYDIYNGYSYLNKITDSVGRPIQFTYDYTNHRLSSITAAGRTLYYNYQVMVGNNYLIQVDLPEGDPWKYSYTTSNYELQKITFPYGGTISYGYSDLTFDTGVVAANVKFSVVTQRTTGGRDILAGTWTYSYNSGGASGDVTTVNGPDSYKEEYTNYGWGNNGNGNVWRIGLPMSKKIYQNSSLIYSESFSWSQGTQVSYDEIANANWSGTGGQIYDYDIYVPFLSSKIIARDNKTYTTNYPIGSYDSYGNPKTISETGDKARTTTIVYSTDSTLISKNIVKGKPVSETVSSGDFSCPGTCQTSYTYDSNGNLTQLNKYGVITNYAYNGNGNLSSTTDANNNATSYLWTYGMTSKTTNPIYYTSRVINTNGTIASKTDGRGTGYTSSFTYDGNLRLKNIDPPAGNTTTFTYPLDNSSKTETRGGFDTYYYYDGFGRPTGTSNSKGVTTDIFYQACGLKDYSTSNIGDTVYYDNFGRTTQVLHKDLNDINYTYSGSNVTMTDEDNRATTYTYNAFGDPDEKFLISVTDPYSSTTTYGRNILGSLTSTTQGSITRSFTYNSKNFLDYETHPETGTINYTRDNVGNMTQKSDAFGTKYYTYDNINRLAKIDYGVDSITFIYDKADNRTSMTSPSADIDYTYDQVNRLTLKSEIISGRTYTTQYGYDNNDNLTSITYPSGKYVTYGYNSYNEATSITGFGGSVSSVNYNLASLPTSFSYSNGKNTSITYNSRYFTTRITSSSVVDAGYTYDTRGNTTANTNYLDSPKNQTFTYDYLNRLTGYNGAWGSGSYTYDSPNSVGNRKSKTIAGTTTNYYYTNNRLSSTTGGEPASFSYNNYGSLTGESCSGGYTLTYDELNNLKTFKKGTNTLASFAYDGDGMRVTKTTWKTIVYHYDKDGRTLSETDNNGNLIADYIYLNGKLVAKAEPSNLYFYHTDPAGTALAMTNTSGTVVWKTDYKPFGEEQSITSTIENNEKFAGKEKDKETGLYYFGARYLGPKTGRFVTVDPVGIREKDLLNPQRLNRYSYALNNPYKFVDPDGRELISINLQGIGNTYLDDSFAPKVNAFITNAKNQGVDLTFNSAYRPPEQQAILKKDPSAITPADNSLHSAGFAVDVNFSSLGNSQGGLTGDKKREIIKDSASKAGLDWGGNFKTPDPPHFYHDPGGDRATLIQNATSDFNKMKENKNETP